MTRKILYIITVSLLLPLLFITHLKAQYTIAPSFSMLKGVNDNKPTLTGGGLEVAYTINPHIQLGVAYSLYPARTRDRAFDTYKTRQKDQASNLAITGAYLFLPPSAVVRPFAGTDAGINFASQSLFLMNINTSVPERRKSVQNVLLSPKAGVSFHINKWLSIVPQAQYHFSVQKVKKDFIGYTGSGMPITVSPIQNFYTLSASAAIRF